MMAIIPGMIGTTEIILLFLLVLLLFGGRKIPELMRGLGKGVREFKKGLEGKDDNEIIKNQDKYQSPKG